MHYTFLLHSKITEDIAKNHETEREREISIPIAPIPFLI